MNLKEKIEIYKSYWRVRKDVYALYWEKGNRRGYSPDCEKKFTRECLLASGGTCRDCPNRKFRPLTDEVIERHLSGEQICGFYPLLQGNQIGFIAFDFDDLAKAPPLKLINNFPFSQYYLLTSSSRRGYHVYLFFEELQSASIVLNFRKLLSDLNIKAELFPKQTSSDYLGNLIRTPLIEPLMKKGKSSILTLDFKPVLDPWETLKNWPKLSTQELNSTFFPEKLVSLESKERSEKDWVPPETGDFEAILKHCEALRRIAYGKEEMTHEQRVILLSYALHCKNGIAFLYQLMAQNPDFGTEEGFRKMAKAIRFAKRRNEAPWSCEKLQEKGYCSRTVFCLKPKNGKSPSPIRFAFQKQVRIRKEKRQKFEFSRIESEEEETIRFEIRIRTEIAGYFELRDYAHGRPSGWRGRLSFFDSQGSLIYEDTVTLGSARSRASFQNALERNGFPLDLTAFLHSMEKLLDEENLKKPKLEVKTLSDEEKKKAIKLLRDRPLYQVVKVSSEMGVVGEETLRLIVYLVFTSRILPAPLNLLIKGPSSSGKSYVSRSIMELIPPEGVKYITRATAQSFFHQAEGEMKHKIIFVNEFVGEESASYAIRSAQSEKDLILQITTRNPITGEFYVKEKKVEGPCGFITTTTRELIGMENETRNFSVFTDDSPLQTSRIKSLVASRALGNPFKVSQTKIEEFRNMQRVLEPYPVFIPFAKPVFESFPPVSLRIRRDLDQFKRLLEVITILHQFSREKVIMNGAEYLKATLADYYIAKTLSEKMIQFSIYGLNPRALKVYKKAQEISSEFYFTIHDLKKSLSDWASSSVIKQLKLLCKVDLCEELDESRYRLVRQITNFLPTIQDLFPDFPCEMSLMYDPFTGDRTVIF